MDAIWNTLYDEAKKVLNPRKISEWVEAGGVAAAIETSHGHIYTGVCVDGACTLGICAKRNAIFNMITYASVLAMNLWKKLRLLFAQIYYFLFKPFQMVAY